MLHTIELTLWAKDRKQVARILSYALEESELRIYRELKPVGNSSRPTEFIYPMLYPVSVFIIVRLYRTHNPVMLTDEESKALQYLIDYPPKNADECIFSGNARELVQRVNKLKHNRFRGQWQKVKDSKPKLIRPTKRG